MTKSNNIRRLLAFFVVVASLSLITAIALKLYRGKGKEGLLRKLPQNIDVSLQKIHFTETGDEKKKWDLIADKADYDRKEEVTHLTNIRMIVAGDSSMGDITLTANCADYHNTTKDVTLIGKVVARSASGMEFTTSRAAYIAARSMITTSCPVRFIDGRLTLEGVGMEFLTDTKNLRLLSKVTATIMPGADK
jgi:LPS export ABC transporter protein LptC